jgi:hypothetical protein
MTIYLYKKTHNVTGLQYLGKTIRDPYKYKGSGKHWLRHLKVHGENVETVILKECLSENELATWGKHYSELWDVVNSTEWANLRPEYGDGGDTSKTENYQKWLPRLSEENKRRKWWNNGTTQIFTEVPPDESYIRGRLTFNNVGAKIGSAIQRTKHWITDGKNEMMVHKDLPLPEGFVLGRIESPKKGRKNSLPIL